MKKFLHLGKQQKRPKDSRRQVILDKGYGQNWYKQRKATLERDNYTCQACGKEGRRLKNNRWNLHVHHKSKIKNFVDSRTKEVDYESANDLSNLVTLCQNCHKYYDGRPYGFKSF